MAAPGTSSPFDPKGRKILVVDDDGASVGLLRGILQGAGYDVAEAGSAARALEVYATVLPDLVLLAAEIRGVDGIECCRQLRKTHGAECAPIVIITGKNPEHGVGAALDAGGADHLPKPCEAAEALARIRPHVRNRMLAEQLGKANAAKHRFLAMAAHDLRSPLSSIRGISEFLHESAVGPLSPDQRELVDTIRATSQQALDLVSQLLDVATIESGELKLALDTWNLAELIAASVALVNIEAARKTIRVVFAPPGDGPVLRLDAVKMQQVVDNLLSNAVKYSPPGSTVTVLIRADAAAGTCSFCVRDQGAGIPEGERDKLFKDFGRLSVRPTGGEKSTGLGLVICRRIVEAHHGTIVAENLPTRGCEFRVTLPAG